MDTYNMEELMKEIRKSTNQVASSKADEVKVMKCMLNDRNFKVGVYDKNRGYIGQRCPREEAEVFVRNIVSGATGLDNKSSTNLAQNYEFTTRDAGFLVQNIRDFTSTYLSTGRKFPIMQTGATEANIYLRNIDARNKEVPDTTNPGKTKTVITSPFVKLISESKCPNYEK